MMMMGNQIKLLIDGNLSEFTTYLKQKLTRTDKMTRYKPKGDGHYRAQRVNHIMQLCGKGVGVGKGLVIGEGMFHYLEQLMDLLKINQGEGEPTASIVVNESLLKEEGN